jgi:hypothetical protein
MRWRTRSLVAAALGVTFASPAHACGLWFNSTYLMIPPNPMVSLGLQNVGDYMMIAADAAFKLGDRLVLRPGIGSCRYTGEGGGSEIAFGAAAGMQVWKDAAGKVSANVQVGAELLSYDGGNERNIPIGAAVAMKSSDKVTLFGGAAINLYNDSYDIPGGEGGSTSSSDPSLFAGVGFKTGKVQLTGGIAMFMGDGDSEIAINLGGGMALGTASNAIKSLIRRK